MTMVEPKQLECPECGHKQETMVWQTVNVSVDPDLKDRLMNGEINVFDCKKCKKKTFINTPLLYNDMKQQFCVQYFPQELLDDESFYSDFTKEGTLDTSDMRPGMVELSPYLFTPHIVFEINEMLKYIYFREKLTALKSTTGNEDGFFASLLQAMTAFSKDIGEKCLDELPRHVHFKGKLKAGDVRRETMVGVLFLTKLYLQEQDESAMAERLVDAVQEGFLAECLQGNTGECRTVSELLDNRFPRYVKARNDPKARDNAMKDTMIGIVAACSLGLEDEARIQFATHVGSHLVSWREQLKQNLRA